MPETISLKAYLGKVEDLLSVGQNDEVIHHCRHILQYFPRNVAAYRLLGRALVQNQRWDEARAVFLRVLSAYPDDFDAHAGLCDAYGQKGQSNDAIWHMERAFEQRPSDRALIDRLRELYRRHRNVEQTRIQLTTAAVARQQANAGSYERALETLRLMLARMPDRIDLRLLLARTLWDSDQRIEAAETALDVLETLPDCIGANTIMTQLWLDEERPSDAQRFLNRLEALDPYLALELVQGHATPDETFTLDELDYRRYAQQEMATSQPNWLEGLDTAGFKDPLEAVPSRTSTLSLADRLRPPTEVKPVEEEEWPDLFGVTEDDSPSEPKKAPTTGDLFGDMPDQWSTDWSATSPTPAEPLNTDELFRFANEPDETSEPAFSMDAFGTSENFAIPDSPDLTETQPDPPAAQSAAPMEELPPWLQNTADTIKPAGVTTTLPAIKLDDVDQPDWLRDGVSPEPGFDTFMTEDESVVIPSKPVDPLAWLRGSGVEIDDQQQRNRPNMYEDEGEGGVIADPTADPLSWMRDSGIEMEEPTPGSAPAPTSSELEWMSSGPLSDTDVEDAVTDATGEAHGETDVDFFTWLEQQQQSNRVNASDITIDDDPLEWLNDDNLLADLDHDDDIPGEVDARRPFDRPGVYAGAGTAFLDELLDSASIAQTRKSQNDFMDRYGGSRTPAHPELADEAERQQAMANKGDKQGPDWLNNDSSDDDLEWLSSSGGKESDANAHLADWLNQGLGNDEDEPPLADFDWIDTPESEEPEEPAAEAEPTSAIPDWLADLGPGYVQPEKSMRPTPVEPQAQTSTPIEPTDMPDWLSELGPSYTEPEMITSYAAAPVESIEEQQPPIMAQSPAEPTEPHPEIPDLFAAMTDEPEAQPAAPNWITAMDAQSAVSMATVTNEPDAEDMPEWMSEFASEIPTTSSLEWIDSGTAAPTSPPSAETPADREPVAADLPDWMAEMQPDSLDAQPAVEPEHVTAEPLAEAPMDAPIDTAMSEAVASIDWASNIGPEDAIGTSPLEWIDNGAAAIEAEPAAALPSEQPGASMFDWVNDLAGSDEPESELDDWATAASPSSLRDVMASEQPPVTDFEWLNAATPAIDTKPMAESEEEPVMAVQGSDEPEVDFPELPVDTTLEVEADASGGFEWPSAQPAAATRADFPEWLDDLKPKEEPAAPAIQSEQSFSWLDIGSGTASATPNTESDMPDWLRTVAAASEESEAAGEPAAIEQVDWLSGIGQTPAGDAEETAQPAAEIEQMEWLSAVGSTPEDEAEEPMEPAAEAEQADWLSAVGSTPEDESNEPVEPAAEAEQADWLSAMGSAPEAEAEEPVEPAAEADQMEWLSLGGAPEPEAEETLEPAASLDEPDWMSSAPEAEAEPFEAAISSASTSFDEAPSEPQAEEMPEPAHAEGTWIDSEFELPQEMEAAESVVAEHTPAENAPDWLNAMVPGVDLDYAPAEEEAGEPVEEATQQASPSREFDWLIDVVEEETQPAARTAPTPEPVADVTPEPQPKFSFSKLPAWLRRGGDAKTR